MLRKALFLFLMLFASICYSKLPELSSREVRAKVEEILKAHATYKKITPQIAERILQNFLEELDPSKTYLIEPEIQEWSSPADTLKQQVIDGFRNADFSLFEKIVDVMIASMERRNLLETELESAALPSNVDPSEFKDQKWALSKQELFGRLCKIKSLQLSAAEKMNQMSKEQFLQLVKKRRLYREGEILSPSANQKKNLILTYFLKSVCSALDAHTDYFTPSEANQFLIQVQQRLVGIGAQLRDNLNGFAIVHLLEGSPAAQSNKLKINDLIIAVDNVPVVGMDISDAVELIRGEKGTKVLLTILRESKEMQSQPQKLDIELVRNEVVLEETRLDTSFQPYGDGVIGCVKLFAFYQDPKSSCSQDLKKALEKLKKEHNLKGVILDLRNNSGGLLPQAVAVTGLFINKGIVCSVQDSSGQVQHLRNVEDNAVWEGPLLVVINKASASAAEIVAQTLQDYGRALVVGDKHSFGKGSFQTCTIDTSKGAKSNPQGEYKVTRGIYYTVSGKSPQLVGVGADILVPGILSELDLGESYLKFPLENSSIAPHFDDDLTDIPLQHRKKVSLLYKNHLQSKIFTFTRYLESLKKNSEKRIELNQNYQNFLKEIQKKRYESDTIEIFGQSDLQLQESFNIMKDLVFMLEIQAKQVANF